jgi:gliding motility-associated protein GldL
MKKKRDNSDLINKAISWGASVVIIGVLFKILHIGGSLANLMIGVGLGVEAILFFLMGFNPPAKDPEWERVYPELADDYEGTPVPASRRNVETTPSATAALDKMFADAQINQASIESLGTGLRTFNERVSAINNISDISFAANEFTDKLRTASSKFDSLSRAFEKASENLVAMSNTQSDSQGYHQQVQQLTQNLSSLNAMYERELRDSTAHLQSMNKFYEHLSSTMQNFNESLDDSRMFKEEVNKLARNLASLNAIYGNMLTAMNQPRV